MLSSLYGNYRTRKFTDIYENVEMFLAEYESCGIKKTISDESVETLYYLLYSKYGNSHIANSDENQFKYKVFATIFQYGPTWEKRLDIQSKLRSLTDDEILLGAKQINNHSFNPSTAPSTATLEELTTINEQTSLHYKKSKLDAYSMLTELLATDVTEDFLNKFRKMFLVIVEPQLPLWYETEIQGE